MTDDETPATGTPEGNAGAALRLAVVSAGASEPSSTRLLADRLSARAAALADERGGRLEIDVIDLRGLAGEIAAALVSPSVGAGLTSAVAALGRADGIVASTPVYAAAPSGLFTSFFQAIDSDLIIATPVVLAATAGTARHALVVDQQMRPLFAYLRALVVPTSLFAAPQDWADPGLSDRIERAARELVALMASGFAREVKNESWRSYQHEFGSAGGTETHIDLDSDLMRLAAGGDAPRHR